MLDPRSKAIHSCVLVMCPNQIMILHTGGKQINDLRTHILKTSNQTSRIWTPLRHSHNKRNPWPSIWSIGSIRFSEVSSYP